LPIYNRFQQLISDEERTVWIFWNESARGSATTARDTTEVIDADGIAVEQITQETVNDRNDRAIRQTIHYYDTHLASLAPPAPGSKHPVLVLLTDDRGNRLKAKEQGLHAVSVKEYVEGMTDMSERERLSDLVARTAFVIEEDESRLDQKNDVATTGETAAKRVYDNVSEGSGSL
jgi:exosome complex exonuclease DIS3/RRP44